MCPTKQYQYTPNVNYEYAFPQAMSVQSRRKWFVRSGASYLVIVLDKNKIYNGILHNYIRIAVTARYH